MVVNGHLILKERYNITSIVPGKFYGVRSNHDNFLVVIDPAWGIQVDNVVEVKSTAAQHGAAQNPTTRIFSGLDPAWGKAGYIF